MAGDYRAPKSRVELTCYYWFCLEHVRQYNLAWNYYAGMSSEEIEAENRTDVTWKRPTWPFAASRPGPGVRSKYQAQASARRRFTDDFGFFDTGEGSEESLRSGGARPEETRAMAIFNLSYPVTLAEVKNRYKELVKRHHPDANGGDKQAEERIKIINQAYTTLRSFVTD